MHYIQGILSTADDMNTFVQGLPTLTKIGSQGKSVDRIEVREVLEKAIISHREAFEEIKRKVFVEPSIPHFTFGFLPLDKLFESLISNAIKFIGDPPDPRIDIEGSEPSEWRVCEVSIHLREF